MMQVMSKELKAHGYFKEKGVVEKLFNKYVAQITMLKSGDVLQVRMLEKSPLLVHLNGRADSKLGSLVTAGGPGTAGDSVAFPGRRIARPQGRAQGLSRHPAGHRRRKVSGKSALEIGRYPLDGVRGHLQDQHQLTWSLGLLAARPLLGVSSRAGVLERIGNVIDSVVQGA